MLRVCIRAPRPLSEGDDLAPGMAGSRRSIARLHRVDVRGVRAQQDALRQLVVLGLAEQIHRDPVGGRAAIGQHQDFARAGDHVDADRTEHPRLALAT
jgi:hypothetical protein